MDPNEIHSVLSPSRVNSFIECPGAWMLRYLHKLDTRSTPAMEKGLRIEDWVNAKLNGEFCETESEDELKCCEQAYGAIKSVASNSVEQQVPISHDGRYPIPMIGYIDYYDKEAKHIIDLKTTARMPLERPPFSHLRQMICYGRAVPCRGITLVYVQSKVPKRTGIPAVKIFSTNPELNTTTYSIDVDDLRRAGKEVDTAISMMMYHIRVFKDTGKCYLPIDFSNYRMSGFNMNEVQEIETRRAAN